MLVNFCSFGLHWQQVASLDGGPARCNPFHHTRGAWLKVFCHKLHISSGKWTLARDMQQQGHTGTHERLSDWIVGEPPRQFDDFPITRIFLRAISVSIQTHRYRTHYH